MPRVQGMDTDRRRRPNRGIFSLATPFNQQQHQQHQHSAAASAPPNSSPHHHRCNANGNRNGDAYDDFDNDGGLEFHGTQTQQDLVSTKKKQPSPFAAFEFATKESHHAHENNVRSNASSTEPASMTAHSSDGSSSKNISKMNGNESTSAIRNSSTSKNNNINDTKSTRDQTIMKRPDQFKDGMENDNNEDDSDATTLDGGTFILKCFAFIVLSSSRSLSVSSVF